MTGALDGPRLPAAEGRATALVVFLHGYGADGNDLIEIGNQWRRLLPGAAFVSPHAPERCSASPMGRQWFALSNEGPDDPGGETARFEGAVKARAAIDAFLDAELRSHGLDESRLALVGFSQGSMMAMHVGLRRPLAPAAIVGYSGMLIGAGRLAEARARDRAGRRRLSCSFMATRTRSFRLMRCSSPRMRWPGPIFRPSGTSPSASVMASTAAECATAGSFWRRRWRVEAGAPDQGLPDASPQKKGGRLSAAFKSREETPKEGMCGQKRRTATI